MTDLIHLAHAVARQTMTYPFKVWGFGEGIALEALWQAADDLNTPAYRVFVLELMDRWLVRTPAIVEADHSAPGGLLLKTWQTTEDAHYRDLALQLATHMAALPDHSNGARFHRPTHADYHDYLYVDCMEVDAPFLCELAVALADDRYFDCAVSQIQAYAELLQDPDTGLFYHQFNGATGTVNASFWGRGNGWALLGLLKTLSLLPQAHDAYTELHQRFRRLAKALAAHQHVNGNWSTVIDQPATYHEASLPAMFGYAFARALNAQLLAPAFHQPAAHAWAAMTARLDNGLLRDVSVATPPGDAPHYNTIATGAGFPWGQGPALLFILERLRSSATD